MLDVLTAAQERAASVVENWIPENKGDNIAGIIEEIADITTDYGVVATTVIRVFNHSEIPDGSLYRVAWMGAVLASKWQKFRPQIGDLVAFNYQEDVTPKAKGMNPYKLIESVIIDSQTNRARLPVDSSIHVPTTADIANADPLTGEIIPPAMSAEELRERFRQYPDPANEPLRPGETAL